MKRRILLIIAVFALSICSCFATEEHSYELQPAYASIISAQARININGNTASYNVTIMPKSKDSVSKIVITLKLVKNKGTVVQTKTETVYFSNGYFKMNNKKILTAKGSYHTEYTAKVYKGSKLLETLRGKSNVATY